MEQMTADPFGEVLKHFRKYKRLSQQALADRLGVHRNTISVWERGDFLPESKTMILELARHLVLNDQETRLLLEASLTALTPHWSVPFPRNALFTGREEVLEALHQGLCVHQTVVSTPSYALHGLGGIGKTHVAIEYAYRYALEYTAVFWIEAESLERIVASFLVIAELLHLSPSPQADHPQIVAAVQRWLAYHQGWLLIWDNVEDLELLRRWLPSTRKGALLFTTRRQTLGALAQGIALPTMREEEGLLLLLRRAKILPGEAKSKQVWQLFREKPGLSAAAHKLVTVLGGLPLALDQAGAYVEETPCLLEDYLELYQVRRATLLKRRGDAVVDHPASVIATWSLSFERVEHLDAAAADLLRLCAFLHPDAIPEELFREGAALLGEQLGLIGTDALQAHRVFQTVCAYSLLKRQVEERTLSIHRLVQAVLWEQMDEHEREVWQWRAIRALNMVFPDIRPETWPQCERFLPHMVTCAATFPEETYDQDLAEVLRKAADYSRGRARFAQAEPLYQRALHIEEQLVGPDHLRLAAPLYGLALLLYELGKYVQAEPLAQRALALWEGALDPEDPELARPLIGLAIICLAQGKYTQTEHLCQRALWLREQALGPEHALVIAPVTNLAEVYLAQGKDQEAEAFYLRAIQIQEQTLGAEHPQMAYPLYGLGRLYTRQGKYGQAEELYRQVLHIREQTLGTEHPYVFEPLTGLAIISFKRREYTQAEALYQRAVQLCECTLGPEHPETTVPLANLAELYMEQGKDEQAGALYEQVIRIREQWLGQEHAETIQARHDYHRLLERRQSKSNSQAERQQSVIQTRQQEDRATTSAEAHPLRDFVTACCELHPRAWSRARDLWLAYNCWVEEQQERFPLSRRAFTAELKTLGCRTDRTAAARIWRGITLVSNKG